MTVWRLDGVLKHPVLHFFVIGALLFGVNALRRPNEPAGDARVVAVDQAQLQALAGIWRAQFGRPPTSAELQTVARAWAEEEMRVREAERLGLDKDDSVIRRRLAQKFDFVVNNPSSVPEPSEGQLKAYYEAHKARYAQATRFTFRDVFFSLDRGAARALDAAKAALSSGAPAGGDSFPDQAVRDKASPEDLRRDFGLNFASALPKLRPGVWEGPVESGFGYHLVKVTARSAPIYPPFASVRGQVTADWLADQTASASAKAIADLHARYQVKIDDAAIARIASGARP